MAKTNNDKATVLDLYKHKAADAAVMGHHEKLLRCLDVLELIWEDEDERIGFCHDLARMTSKFAKEELR